MGLPDLPLLIDRLNQAKARDATSTHSAGAARSSPEAALGLKFAPGDRVLDLATGRQGRIVRGAFVVGAPRQTYELALDTGPIVLRDSSELEKVTAPAPPVTT